MDFGLLPPLHHGVVEHDVGDGAEADRPLEAEGMSSLAIQQGGLGLILTVALITVPPMVGMFFHGALRNFLQFPAFGSGGQTQGDRPSGHGRALAGAASPKQYPDETTYGASKAGTSYDQGARRSYPSAVEPANQDEIRKK